MTWLYIRENRAMFSLKRTLLLATVLLLPLTTQAWDFNANARKKQEAKDAQRWSLSQWLEQKSRIKLMDSWLGYNQPSPYEFFFSLDTSTVEVETISSGTPSTESFRNYRGAFGAFVTMVGLYGEYETSDEEIDQWKALFMLRLLGSSDQSTNLTLHYGLINRTFNEDPTQFQTGGGRISLYILKPLALTGQYDYFFKAESEAGVEQEGSRTEAGAFIEYGALRFYGSWYEETIDFLNSPTQSQRTRRGVLFGTRLYF